MTLLLTACVDPGSTPYLKHRDVAARLAEYEASMARWIDESDFDDIVFCENSGYEHGYDALRDRAASRGKRLEILVFKGNDEAQLFGKGYGEGRIIEYALEHSSLLAGEGSFYKATGRIFVRNANRILAHDARKPSAFILFTSWKYVDTRFFKAEKEFYRRALMDAYKEVRDSEKISIERVFRERLRGSRIPPLSEYPDILGLCASSGERYDLPRPRLALANAMLRVGLYTV